MIRAAKFVSVCPMCRRRIAVGERIRWTYGWWMSGGKAVHVSCGPADVALTRLSEAAAGPEES